MLDLYSFPSPFRANVQTFSSAGTAWVTWMRPRGASMIHVVTIGGGGGAGGAASGANNTDRGGGGGGGSSAISSVTISASYLPERLYVQVGAGGSGGAGGAAGQGSDGTAGALSYVAVYPSTTTDNILCVSGSSAPTQGIRGTGVAGGAGGGAGGIATLANMPVAGYGAASFIIGQAGGAGGFSGNGASIAPTTSRCTGGCGGGGASSTIGVAYNGGTFTATANTWLANNVPPAATVGQNGSGGTAWTNPLFNLGGGGGGGSGTATGGIGGNGAYGAGGGGGGAGLTGNAGRGGDGGGGLVLIIAW